MNHEITYLARINTDGSITSAQEVQRERFAKAFALWETEYRADPAKFFTPDEIAAMDELPLADARAVCFERFLHQ